jgi:IS5 family transposase
MRTARRRAAELLLSFIAVYCIRSGIEGTNSQLARQFGIKRLRARGLRKVDMKVRLKALALDIWRVARFIRQNARVVK